MARLTDFRRPAGGEASLDWQGEDMLGVLRALGARPGVGVGLKRLWLSWSGKYAAHGQDAYGEGIRQLAAAQLIEPVTDDTTDIVLTDAGYRH